MKFGRMYQIIKYRNGKMKSLEPKNEKDRTGKSLENSWKILGKSQENPRKIPGKSRENPWKIPRKSLENPWKISGKSLENPRKIPGKTLENPEKIFEEEEDRIIGLRKKCLRKLGSILLYQKLDYDQKSEKLDYGYNEIKN